MKLNSPSQNSLALGKLNTDSLSQFGGLPTINTDHNNSKYQNPPHPYRSEDAKLIALRASFDSSNPISIIKINENNNDGDFTSKT